MPAKSQAQQKAAGAALSAKRGQTKKSELKGASKSMYELDERKAAGGVCRDRSQEPAEEEDQTLIRSLGRANSLADARLAFSPMTAEIEVQIALMGGIAIRADHRHEAVAACLVQRPPKGLLLRLALPA